MLFSGAPHPCHRTSGHGLTAKFGERVFNPAGKFRDGIVFDLFFEQVHVEVWQFFDQPAAERDAVRGQKVDHCCHAHAQITDGVAEHDHGRILAAAECVGESLAADVAESALGFFIEIGKLAGWHDDSHTFLKGEPKGVKHVSWSAPLAEKTVAALADAHRTTPSAVLLASLGGALHDYLRRRGDPTEGVRVGNPVEALTEADGLTPDSVAYLCGPPGMIAAARKHLEGLGLSPENIFAEQFVASN